VIPGAIGGGPGVVMGGSVGDPVEYVVVSGYLAIIQGSHRRGR